MTSPLVVVVLANEVGPSGPAVSLEQPTIPSAAKAAAATNVKRFTGGTPGEGGRRQGMPAALSSAAGPSRLDERVRTRGRRDARSLALRTGLAAGVPFRSVDY